MHEDYPRNLINKSVQ